MERNPVVSNQSEEQTTLQNNVLSNPTTTQECPVEEHDHKNQLFSGSPTCSQQSRVPNLKDLSLRGSSRQKNVGSPRASNYDLSVELNNREIYVQEIKTKNQNKPVSQNFKRRSHKFDKNNHEHNLLIPYAIPFKSIKSKSLVSNFEDNSDNKPPNFLDKMRFSHIKEETERSIQDPAVL